eukprot:219911-Pleurochrysis_carterae.AAC.1
MAPAPAIKPARASQTPPACPTGVHRRASLETIRSCTPQAPLARTHAPAGEEWDTGTFAVLSRYFRVDIELAAGGESVRACVRACLPACVQ